MNRVLPSPLTLSREAQDWRWQLRHAVRTAAELAQHLNLTCDEMQGALAAERAGLPLTVTPYYLSLCDTHNPDCPIRKQIVPTALEQKLSNGEFLDPLGELQHEVAPELIRRYPDRALLLVHDQCAAYCRFCTRSRWVGQAGGVRSLDRLGQAFEYLRAHPEVRDVIVSGGDPLTLATARIATIFAELRRIDSIETIRLATRVPVTLPQRVTDELVSALRPFHPIWVLTHFNHVRELTPLSQQACIRLADAGFPVMNQTVLLRGINDSSRTLSELFRALIRFRVRPYYLLQGDPAKGTGHLRTPLEAGLQIMAQLQG